MFCLALSHFACANLPELVDHTTEQTAGRIGQQQTRLGKVNGLDVTALVRLEVDTSELENLQKALTFILDLNEWLRRCEEEGRDGTHLGGCVKFYLPRPTCQWGAVLTGRGGGET